MVGTAGVDIAVYGRRMGRQDGSQKFQPWGGCFGLRLSGVNVRDTGCACKRWKEMRVMGEIETVIVPRAH